MAPSIRTQFSRRCPALCGVGGTLHRGSWGSTVGASAVGLGGCSYLSLRFYSIILLCFSAFSYLSITISIMIYLSLSIYHCLSIYLTNLPIDPCIHVSMYPCIHASIHPSVHPSTHLRTSYLEYILVHGTWIDTAATPQLVEPTSVIPTGSSDD